MATNLYLDETTKDLIVENYNLRLTENQVEYVSQKIETRLRFFKNEWFLNRDLGLPYFETILKKNPDLKLVTSLFKNEITNIEGIEEIIKFEVNLDNATRTFTIYFEVRVDENVADGTIIL